jgi:hypothetical protein
MTNKQHRKEQVSEAFDLPEAIDAGESVLFRVNKDGSLTKGWYHSGLQSGLNQDATSEGHRVKIENYQELSQVDGMPMESGYRVQLDGFGWFKNVVERNTQTGAVENEVIANIIGARWGYKAQRSAGTDQRKNWDIVNEQYLENPKKCLDTVVSFLKKQESEMKYKNYDNR